MLWLGVLLLLLCNKVGDREQANALESTAGRGRATCSSGTAESLPGYTLLAAVRATETVCHSG